MMWYIFVIALVLFVLTYLQLYHSSVEVQKLRKKIVEKQQEGGSEVMKSSTIKKWLMWKGMDSSKADYYAQLIVAASSINSVDPYLVAAIIYQESKYDQYAKGDKVEKDYYGGGFTSFGLMQIRTYKEKAEEWSTFDFIVMHSKDPVLQWLKFQSMRDEEVRRARRNDLTSALFDPQINIHLGASYLGYISQYRKTSDPYELALYYNRGHGAKYVEGWGYSISVLNIIWEIISHEE